MANLGYTFDHLIISSSKLCTVSAPAATTSLLCTQTLQHTSCVVVALILHKPGVEITCWDDCCFVVDQIWTATHAGTRLCGVETVSLMYAILQLGLT
jgi:hypothetical protein